MTRRFDDAPVEDELILELCDLARRAPSAGYSQGVHLLVLSGHDVDRFWELTGAREWFADRGGVLAAPVIVLPLADPRAYTARYAEPDKAGHGLENAAAWPVPYWLVDAGMVAENLLLLAEDRGLGALLFGIFRNEDVLLAELGVPPGVRPVGAVALGWRAADDQPSGSAVTRARRPRSEVVHQHRW